MKNITQAQLLQVRDLYFDGEKFGDIAKKAGVSENYIKYFVRSRFHFSEALKDYNDERDTYKILSELRKTNGRVR